MSIRRVLVVLLVLWAAQVEGEANRPTLVVRPFVLATQPSALPATLADTWSHQWSAAGFEPVDGTEAHPARFEASGVFAVEGDDLVLQVAVTDGVSHAVVASDMLTIYQGLTAFEPVNRLLLGVTQRVKAYWESLAAHPLPVPPVVDALTFESSDEGAEVFWQGHQAVGQIRDGQLAAPYYPFPSNAVLTLTIEKDGYRTKVVDLPLDSATSTYTLPKLDRLRVEEWHVFDQIGRVLGVGVEYRRYIVPDWAFWSAEAYPFLQYRPGTVSRPVAHLDTAASVGTWIGFSADSWFRLGVQSSLGLSQTVTISSEKPAWYLDATISPMILLLEWKVGSVWMENRLQIPYSFGLPTGVISPSWLLAGSLPLLSVGGVFQW